MPSTRAEPSVIVADASVVYLAVAHDGPAGFVARVRLEGETVHAPHVLDPEVVNGLRGNLRRGNVDRDRAALALADLARSRIVRVQHRGLLPRMWELRDNLTAYDASYVALAEVRGVTLVTADARIAAAPGIRCDVEVLATPS